MLQPLLHLSSHELLNTFMIDVRHPEAFAESHVKNALNIPLGAQFCNWVGMIVPKQMPLALIVPNSQIADQLAKSLWMIGYDKIAGYSLWEDLSKEAISLDALPLLQVQDVAQGSYWILDVRTPAEWHSGHIHNAHQIELAKLSQALSEIPRDSSIATICGSGFRSSVAASFLRKAGFASVINIQGGMQAWHQARLPLSKAS